MPFLSSSSSLGAVTDRHVLVIGSERSKKHACGLALVNARLAQRPSAQAHVMGLAVPTGDRWQALTDATAVRPGDVVLVAHSPWHPRSRVQAQSLLTRSDVTVVWVHRLGEGAPWSSPTLFFDTVLVAPHPMTVRSDVAGGYARISAAPDSYGTCLRRTWLSIVPERDANAAAVEADDIVSLALELAGDLTHAVLVTNVATGPAMIATVAVDDVGASSSDGWGATVARWLSPLFGGTGRA